MARPPSSATRDEVLLAALEILREKGSAALTVRAVAAAAGCSTMAVYTHFEGKAGLVDAILADGHAALATALARGAEKNEYGDVLVSVAMAYRAWALANPTHYEVMYLSLVPDFEPSEFTRSVADAGYAAHVDRVRAALSVDRVTAERVAHHLWASVHGHVLLAAAAGVGLGDPKAEARYLEAAWWLRRGVTG